MRVTPTSDDFREIAERLCIVAKDLVPVPGKKLRWRVLPEVLREYPALFDLTRTYNRDKAPEIMKRARDRGRRLILKKGPEWYLVGKTLSAGPGELFVCIVVRSPLGQSNGPPGLRQITDETHKPFPSNQTTLKSLQMDDRSAKPHDSYPAGNIPVKRQRESESGTDNPASLTSESQQPRLNIQVVLEILRRKLEYMVRNATDGEAKSESPALHIGDIFEIYEETLEVQTGGIPMLWMGYTEEEIVDESRAS